ncbi:MULTISPECIES: hypothetical protein [Oceanobacillus]|uniref:Uncharacterized protein n=1 Tax=Oceanobacillus kimchii TaxID=746691 RepID=A0ABQ5TEA7_9BACI|nr:MULTISPECIES: hypothetical protein [Oceanobacillus]MBT2600616.1 hypothetical protein [Oceanobacillus sp. ISL-74]MBT2650987.1 hypothetical protein [Oceanobacillus sp. ISL-73]OEH53417.1 hypothetical protein AQ616_17110 [Oceanobacillus sp. E9]GLO65154.1 hypothetical protein MACH08_09380 [Oceanobacillus kimchii]
MKKWMISIIMLLTIGVVIAKVNSPEVTFAHVLPEEMNDSTEIKEITIYEIKPSGKPREIVLSDKQDIDKLLQVSKNMKLKQTDEYAHSGYLLLLSDENQTYTITVNDDGILDMDTHDNHYTIKGENDLLKIIKSFEDKWEPVQEEE